MLQWIPLARSWHLLARVGIVTIAVAAATALQLPVGADFPGEPFLLYFVAVVASASVLGRTAGFVAVAERNQHCLNALPRSCLLTEIDPFDRPACNRDLRGSRRSKR